MYEHDPAEVTDLGWEEFILRQWESIFVGYRTWTGLRTLGRRWSDLIEAGLGCSPEVANELVSATVIRGQDRQLESTADPAAVVAGMTEALASIPAALADLPGLSPAAIGTLLTRHDRLLSFLKAQAAPGG
ncbi:MAG: hypothetical protein ACLPKI_33125 [Streptosporangiaceae bacterium]